MAASCSSAVYGSDAVCGAVNLQPRRTLDGVETSFRYASADDMYRWSAGPAFGQLYNSGQLMVAYEHNYRSQLEGSDRDFYTADQRAMGGGWDPTAASPIGRMLAISLRKTF